MDFFRIIFICTLLINVDKQNRERGNKGVGSCMKYGIGCLCCLSVRFSWLERTFEQELQIGGLLLTFYRFAPAFFWLLFLYEMSYIIFKIEINVLLD